MLSFYEKLFPESRNDTKHVLMFCGLGIYLQMTVDDAIEFSEKREKVMEDKLNIIVSEASKIKATMKLVLEVRTLKGKGSHYLIT